MASDGLYSLLGVGPLPAKRHQNPDGTLGGWVQDTAHVASTAYIGPDVRVLDLARVLDTSRVEGTSSLAERSVVSGSSKLEGKVELRNSVVVENSTLEGSLVLMDRVRVVSSKICGVEPSSLGGCAEIRDSTLFGQFSVGGRSVVDQSEVVGEDLNLSEDCFLQKSTVSGTSIHVESRLGNLVEITGNSIHVGQGTFVGNTARIIGEGIGIYPGARIGAYSTIRASVYYTNNLIIGEWTGPVLAETGSEQSSDNNGLPPSIEEAQAEPVPIVIGLPSIHAVLDDSVWESV